MARLRNAVSFRLQSACFVCFLTANAQGQSCHLPPRFEQAEAKVEPFTASLRTETAGFSTPEYEGHYEGVIPDFAFRERWFEAQASLPVYRIVRNGRSDLGPGDVLLQARAALVGDRTRDHVLGLELAASLPTGDPERELGMGHVMLMPSAWGTLTSGRFGFSARAGYARAIVGSSTHHHHAGGMSPLVDPMNESELDGALAGSLAVTRLIGVRAGFYGAVPVAVTDGQARAAGFAGFGVDNGRVSSDFELHLPVAGDPFTVKLLLELGVRF
jgi:hypothetical protein